MIFRFRDELREGNDVETALVETMTHHVWPTTRPAPSTRQSSSGSRTARLVASGALVLMFAFLVLSTSPG
jgi:hypothetical protein